ncbi:MAG: DUF2007 domain-containing protein [Vicinamibacteraceae bacterium]|nr:DUF2007 domain-containing protein [Vicinamibacteraceae bacterium]
MSEPVTVMNFNTRLDAEVARAALAAADIASTIVGDDAGGLVVPIGVSTGGIHLVVNSEDEERAREVLGGLTESVRDEGDAG